MESKLTIDERASLSTSDFRPFSMRDFADYRPKNRIESPDPGLFVLLTGMLIGALVVAPLWIGIFELILGRR